MRDRINYFSIKRAKNTQDLFSLWKNILSPCGRYASICHPAFVERSFGFSVCMCLRGPRKILCESFNLRDFLRKGAATIYFKFPRDRGWTIGHFYSSNFVTKMEEWKLFPPI